MTTVPGQRVADYMHRQVEGVPQDASVGIVTETDLVGKVLAPGLVPSRTCMADIMSSPVITIAPDRPMVDAGQLMETKNVRHLMVADGSDVLGVISVRDLVRHFVAADSGPVQSLNDVYRPLR